METFSSKLGFYGSNYRTPKATNAKTSFSFEPQSGTNKENFLDTLRKEKQAIKPDDKQSGIVRAPSYDKRTNNQVQTSYIRNIQDPLTTSSLSNLNSALVFNSPRYDGGVTLFGSQDKGSYKSKYDVKPTRTPSSRPEEKPAATGNKSDPYAFSRMEQSYENALSTRDKNRPVITSRTNSGISQVQVEERNSDAVNIYNRILGGNRSPTSQGQHSIADQSILSKNNPQRSSLELFSKQNEKKRIGNFDIKMSSMDIDDMMKPSSRDIDRTTPIVLQKKTFDDRKVERSPDYDRFSLTRNLTISTEDNNNPSKLVRAPMTTKNSRGDPNIQNLYESLANVKRSLERQPTTVKSSTPTETSITNYSHDERERNYRPATPKSTNKATTSDTRSILQGIKNNLPSETKNTVRESRESREFSDATYESYLKGVTRSSKTHLEQATPTHASYINRNREKDVSPVPTRKYDEPTVETYSRVESYSRQPVKNGYNNYENYSQYENYKSPSTTSSYLKSETVDSNQKCTRQEQPTQEKPTKSLKDFITQVNPGKNNSFLHANLLRNDYPLKEDH